MIDFFSNFPLDDDFLRNLSLDDFPLEKMIFQEQLNQTISINSAAKPNVQQFNNTLTTTENVANKLSSQDLPQIAQILSTNNKDKYCDITEYLTLPQHQAAKQLKMGTTTLSKRWKVASRGRKWPARTIRKIDKELETLFRNAATNDAVQYRIAELLKQRQDELSPISILLL